MWELLVIDNDGCVVLRQHYQMWVAAYQEAELYNRDDYDNITITKV